MVGSGLTSRGIPAIHFLFLLNHKRTKDVIFHCQKTGENDTHPDFFYKQLVPKRMIHFLDGLEVFSSVYGVPVDSSKLQMVRVRHIYRPPSP